MYSLSLEFIFEKEFHLFVWKNTLISSWGVYCSLMFLVLLSQADGRICHPPLEVRCGHVSRSDIQKTP